MTDLDQLTQATTEVREIAKTGLSSIGPVGRLRLLDRVHLLRSLPAVQAAGRDSTAQFEYLVQAIQDAIDVIASNIGPVASIDEPKAMLELFGLTKETRSCSWRFRQDTAARSLSLGWDHFRHAPQERLLQAVAERLLLTRDTVRRTSAFPKPGGLNSCATQHDIEGDLIAYIRTEVPPIARLLELSTATVQPIMEALRDSDVPTRLLVVDPAVLTSTWHRDRVRSTILNLFSSGLVAESFISIRMYRQPPSLRGRLIGDIISLGWYTHRDNKRLESTDPSSTEVWGHDNAMIVGHRSEQNAALLAEWFEREFQRLWTHRTTVGASTIGQRLAQVDSTVHGR